MGGVVTRRRAAIATVRWEVEGVGIIVIDVVVVVGKGGKVGLKINYLVVDDGWNFWDVGFLQCAELWEALYTPTRKNFSFLS